MSHDKSVLVCDIQIVLQVTSYSQLRSTLSQLYHHHLGGARVISEGCQAARDIVENPSQVIADSQTVRVPSVLPPSQALGVK